MKKTIKIMFAFVVSLCLVVSLSGCNKNENNNDKLTIISTSFPGYDFSRAIVKDVKNAEVKMLLKPGSESHSYEPTPQDIINIKNSDIFIYVGGDSDSWIEDVLDDIDSDKTKVVKLMDLVNVKEEELIEGMEEHEHHEDHEDHEEEHEDHEDEHEHHDGEHEHHDGEEVEYDEHVWTSPVNAITIINKLKQDVINIDSANEKSYEKNANNYISELNKIDIQFKDVVSNGKRKEIIFGDRFPLRYFVDEYGLSYYAAFPGCSGQTEASAKTISFLINKIKEDKIPVVFHIELSSGKIAEAIKNETGAKVLQFNAAHNISQKDFDAGVTYVDIMNDNISVLREALN